MASGVVMAVASLLAAGSSAYSSHKQASQAKKTYRLSKKAAEDATAKAEADAAKLKKEKKRLADLDIEKKRKLIAAGEKVPETILTGPAGLRTTPSIHHKTLLG